MSPFQLLSLPLLAFFIAFELWRLATSRHGWRRIVLLRVFVWAAAAAAIAQPGLPQTVAGWLGIDRGADLVLYLAILSFLYAAFRFEARLRDLQLQLTEVVRLQALRDARPPSQPEAEARGEPPTELHREP